MLRKMGHLDLCGLLIRQCGMISGFGLDDLVHLLLISFQCRSAAICRR